MEGVYILKSANPTGPFEFYADRLTPEDWTCIDGTLWFEDGVPYLIFSHSFEDIVSGLDGDCYFSDGPNVLKLDDGKLYMIVSSWSVNGYAVDVAVSDNEKIEGLWRQQEEPLWPENGGHGMFFKDLNGELIFTLHYLNDKYHERPTFWKVKLEDGVLKLDGRADGGEE